MPNYQNGKIYKIWSPQTELIYIGSTVQSLAVRFGEHKRQNDTTAKEILKYGDAKIELICNYPCNNKEELNKCEGELIRQYIDICINIRIEGRTKQEYRQDNKETIAEKHKIYRKNNSDEISKQKHDYYKSNRDEILQRQQEYYDNNRDEILQQQQEYYENNKDQINQRKSQPYNCICGSTVRINDKARHFKSDKHNQYLQDNLLHLLDL